MPLAWDGLLADSSDSVSHESFVPSFTVSGVARDTSAIRPVKGVVDREFYLLAYHSVQPRGEYRGRQFHSWDGHWL